MLFITEMNQKLLQMAKETLSKLDSNTVRKLSGYDKRKLAIYDNHDRHKENGASLFGSAEDKVGYIALSSLVDLNTLYSEFRHWATENLLEILDERYLLQAIGTNDPHFINYMLEDFYNQFEDSAHYDDFLKAHAEDIEDQLSDLVAASRSKENDSY